MIEEIIKKYKIYGFKKFFQAVFLELYTLIYYRLIRGSFSQKGEDLVIDKLLGNKKSGFYIDIGANDPVRFSNTCRFYKKGWTGINIEPNPLLIKKINEFRPKDLNLNLGIAGAKSQMTFYSFFPDTLSTFSEEQAAEYQKEGFTLIDKLSIQVDSLENVFDQQLNGREIDFLSIDTESFDLIVLKSNNWKKYRPKIVCIEFNSDQAKQLLEENDYKKVFDNGLNVLYSNLQK